MSPSKFNLDGLPRERYWGLGLLREREEFQLTPWPVGGQPLSIMHRIADRVVPAPTMFGYTASHSLIRRLRAAQENYDVVLSFHHVATASLLALRQEGQFRPCVICLAIGIADWLEKAASRERSWALYRLAGADCLLAMSKAEVELLQTMGLDQTVFLPFGVDTEYWSPRSEPVEDYVFAVGSDPCRDFDTLVQSCPYPLRVMTRSRHLVTIPLSPNASFVQGDTAALRSLYAGARVVVVPLKDRLQPSGQNSALQAMAMAKPVILTRTRGVWSDQLRDKENCLYVQTRDPHDLQEALRLLYDNPPLAQAIGARARETARRHFDAYCLANALSEIVRQVVDS